MIMNINKDTQKMQQGKPANTKTENKLTPDQIQQSWLFARYFGLIMIVLGLVWLLIAPQSFFRASRMLVTWSGTILMGVAVLLIGSLGKRGMSVRSITITVMIFLLFGSMLVAIHGMIAYN